MKFLLVLLSVGLAFGQLPKPGGGVGGGGSGSPPYEAAFSAATSVSVTAATHGKGANAIVEACFDNATPRNTIAFSAGYPTVAANGDVVAQWSGSKTGKCYISAGDSGGTGPAGATGATGATGIGADVGNSGEVIISQGTGVAPTTDDGLAFNTSTNSLGVKGNVTIGQTSTATGEIKINGLTSGTVTIKTADTAGTWTMTLPANDGNSGQFLQTNGSGVTSWASGAGGGAGAYTDLTDSQVTLDTGTDTVTIAAGKVQVNGVSADCPASSQTLTNPTATTGTVWIACNGSTLTAYHDLTGLTGSGSVTVSGSASGFPSDVIPLATCTVSSNNFGTCTDVRAPLSLDLYTAGTGLSLSGRQFSIGAIVPTFGSSTTVPGSCSAVGQIYFDTDAASGAKLYYCNGSAYEAVSGGGGGVSDGDKGDITVSGSGATWTIDNGVVDLTTKVTGILPTANGGTANAFFTVSGPATSAKTFTFPNASSTVLTSNAAVTVGQGGTGLTSGTSGGIPYFSSTSAMTSSAALASTAVVTGGGAGASPTTSTDFTWDNTNKRVVVNNTDTTGATTGYNITRGGAFVGSWIWDKDTGEMRMNCSPNYASVVPCLRAGVGGSQKSFIWGYNPPAPLADTFGIMSAETTRLIVQAGNAQSTTNVFEIRDYQATLGGTLRFAINAAGVASGSGVATANTASTLVARDSSGNFAAGTITAALTGNASTATALAANPSDCGSNQFANAIAASGNLTCAAIAAADLPAASDTAVGGVELATAAETTTGTDATRAVTPDGLAGSAFGKKTLILEVVADATALTTGDGKAYIPIPVEYNGWLVVGVTAHVGAVVSSSGAVNVDIAHCAAVATGIRCSGTVTDLLSTNLTVDANEDGTETAATAAVIDTANDDLATGDWLRIDVDGAGTSTQGLYLTITIQKP